MTTTAADYASPGQPGTPLDAIADELSDAGYTIEHPAGITITNARRALTDLTITSEGQITWEYRSVDGSHIKPARLAGIALTILRPGQHPATRRRASTTLSRTVTQTAARHGLAVRARTPYPGTAPAYTEIIITDPAAPQRGTVRLTSDGALYWHCHASHPDPRTVLTPAGIAATISHALTTAGHAPTDHL